MKFEKELQKKHLHAMKNDSLTLSSENMSRIVWKIDAAFSAHPDVKSHSGGTMKFAEGEGTTQSALAKQKLVTDGSMTSHRMTGGDQTGGA